MRDYETLIKKTPSSYQKWLAEHSANIFHGEAVVLYSMSSLPERNETNEMEIYLPDHLMIGDDSGDNVFILRCAQESPVFMDDVGSLQLETFVKIAPSFSAWLETGCLLPEEPVSRLPFQADIYVDRVSDLKTMFAIRKLLNQEWTSLQMKDYILAQPLLAIRAGYPHALEQKLERQPSLKAFLFIEKEGNLEQISF